MTGTGQTGAMDTHDASSRVRPRGTIVTLGGGGFSESEDGSSRIDDLLIELTGRERPRVCFVPTASADDADYSARFAAAFAGRAETGVLSLFGRDPWGYRDPALLLEQDLIYVGGGSTVNLLALWHRHDLPAILERAVAGGTVLAGISAGMNCWFEASSTDSFGPLEPLPEGLGFLPDAACPHYHGEPTRRPLLHEWVAAGRFPATWAVDDGAALVWRDGELIEAVSEDDGVGAWRVTRERAEVAAGDAGPFVAVEDPIPVRRLR